MILGLLRDYKKESILAPLFKMLEAIFELFVPLVIAHIIDAGIGRADRAVVLRGALLLLFFAMVGFGCSIKAQYYAAKAAIGACAHLRSSLFKKLESFSFSQIEELGTDTMITRLTADVNQVQNGINMTLRLFLRSPFIVFGAMIMAFTIDFKAALIFAVTIPLLSAVVYGIMLITMPMYKKTQGALDEVLSMTRENLTGVRVIRAFGMEDDEREDFNGKNIALNHIQRTVGKIASLMNPLTFVIVNAATLMLLYTGAVRVDLGILTKGQVVALVNYMSQILVELIKLANLIILITRAMACAGRIETVMNTKGGEEELLDAGGPFDEDVLPPEEVKRGVSVEFKDVCYSYSKNDDGYAVDHVSFKAERGETVGVIGGTGCGKSTLVNLIPGFLRPDRGEIFIDGISQADMELSRQRSMVGIAMQKAVLFSGSIRENLLWGKADAGDEEIEQALKSAQAWEFVRTKKGRLDYVIAQGGRDLSGGQKQRLNIARATVAKPPVIILDDSSSALDFATDAALRASLGQLHDEYAPTVFIVSQRVSSIMRADKIIVMDEGRVAGIGTHDELLESCPQYKEIYSSQSDE